MMGGRGSGGIQFGSISLWSDKETIEELRKQLEYVLRNVGYPSSQGISRESEDGKKDEDGGPVDVDDLPEMETGEGVDVDDGEEETDEDGEEPVQQKVMHNEQPWLRSRK